MNELENPQDFLDRTHPENDDYMRGIEHVQRQIMQQTALLRPKQVSVLKSVFSGLNYKATAQLHHTTGQTVSRLARSPNGQRLLNLLQYHLKMIEGPNEAQRRAMLWRIAITNEKIKPNTAITAIDSLNKVQFQKAQLDAPATQPQQVTININQDILPKGTLDR
jgi:hypothetical protein